MPESITTPTLESVSRESAVLYVGLFVVLSGGYAVLLMALGGDIGTSLTDDLFAGVLLAVPATILASAWIAIHRRLY